jgi:hypothetical protein
LGEDDDFSFEQDEKAWAAIKPLEKNGSKLPLKKRPLRTIINLLLKNASVLSLQQKIR